MVQCEICGRAYVAQAIASRPGEPYYRYYVHRTRDGACHHDCLSARKLEDKAWRDVTEAILDSDLTRRGYADAKEQQEATLKRTHEHLATLQQNLIKLERRRDNLNRAYTDPDIQMTKSEYLTQKNDIDDKATEVTDKIAGVQEELLHIPQPADLETFEAFTSEIRAALKQQVEPTPEKKRQLLEMLHVKVIVKSKGEREVKGWYTPKKFSQMSSPSPSPYPTR